MATAQTLHPRSTPGSSLILAGDRAAAVVAFEEEMVAFFVEAAELLGVPKSVAAIYGILFASPAPLSFADIEARVNFSKGSVSQGLRMLREVGAIREVPSETARIARFSPDTEMRRLMQRFLEQRLEKQLDQGKRRLKTLQRAAGGFPPSDRPVIAQRVEKLQSWHDRTRALMPIIKTFLKLTKI